MLGRPTRAFEGWSSGFNSMVEYNIVNVGVRGSNPLTRTNGEVAELVDAHRCGSVPFLFKNLYILVAKDSLQVRVLLSPLKLFKNLTIYWIDG